MTAAYRMDETHKFDLTVYELSVRDLPPPAPALTLFETFIRW
jgi:hypothetical protein